MKLLKQSTASQVIMFGPFVDKTDGVTAETGLVSALDNGTTGILLSKNGGTRTIRHATVTATTHDSNGYYKVTLDATDTNTCGRLHVAYSDDATCLPVFDVWTVVPANVYESLVLGVEWLEVTSLANKVGVSGSTMTIYKQDDATTQFTNVGTFTTGADVLTQMAGKT